MTSMTRVLSMAMGTPQPLGFTGILRESLQLPTRNVKLMVSNTLLVLIPFLILAVSHDLIAGPLLMEVEDHDPDDGLTPEFQKHFQILMVLESIFFLIFCILSLFAMAMTVNASAATYTGKYLSLKDVFSRTMTTWKRPVITCLYIVLIAMAYAFLVALLLGAFVLIADGSVLITCISLVGILAFLFYLYIALICLQGLAISIVEETCYGIEALVKAEMLMKGRKLQGFALMLFLLLLSAPVWALFSLNTVEDEIEPEYQVALGIVGAVVVCLMKLFGFVVYTVLYYQCRSNIVEREDLEEGAKHKLVSTDESDLHVIDSLS
ncbi:hypothetical protein MRB53_013410 [Persea americana]|uniref:Uncharacterized protein n=1 Tax=Persea americana TaxID=3435 RepID=A0ACC2K7Z0_PERAE|nr:hypothetical protein MRB53_013410 [Persea americana]